MRYLLLATAFWSLQALSQETSETMPTPIMEYFSILNEAAQMRFHNFDELVHYVKQDWIDELDSGAMSEERFISLLNNSQEFTKTKEVCNANPNDLERYRKIYTSRQKSFDDEKLDWFLKDAFSLYSARAARHDCLKQVGWILFRGN